MAGYTGRPVTERYLYYSSLTPLELIRKMYVSVGAHLFRLYSVGAHWEFVKRFTGIQRLFHNGRHTFEEGDRFSFGEEDVAFNYKNIVFEVILIQPARRYSESQS